MFRRSRRARSSEDGELFDLVGEAQAKLTQAVQICTRVRRENRGVRHRLAFTAERQIQRALGLLQGLRGTEPRYDLDDPDLVPEEQRKAPPKPEAS